MTTPTDRAAPRKGNVTILTPPAAGTEKKV